MKKIILYREYFRKAWLIWVLLIICIYSVLACEFDCFKISLFSIDEDIVFINKMNTIIENLSFSYIAGAIFFVLSDTIPFLRKQKNVLKHIKKSLSLMINAIDSFSQNLHSTVWDASTNITDIVMDITGTMYSQQMRDIKLQDHQLYEMHRLNDILNVNIDFILSQELYINQEFMSIIENIKVNKHIQLIKTISKEQPTISIDILTGLLEDIITIKTNISKLHSSC